MVSASEMTGAGVISWCTSPVTVVPQHSPIALCAARSEGHHLLITANLLRSSLSRICNISLTKDQWFQASRSVRYGGLGVRKVSSLSSSVFGFSCRNPGLQDALLSRCSVAMDDCDVYQCLAGRHHQEMPVGDTSGKQRIWYVLTINEDLHWSPPTFLLPKNISDWMEKSR